MRRALWRRRVDGDALRSLSVEAGRVVVSTGRCSVAFDRDGRVLDTTDVPQTRAVVPLAWLDRRGYRLSEGALVWYDVEDGTVPRSVVVPIEPFAVHGERLAVTFGDRTDDKIRRWHEDVFLVADPARGRLIFAGISIPPWMGALRPDGAVEWVRLMGKNTDCCGNVAVVSGEGTLAHHSGCGNRLTFLDASGTPLSVHELAGPFAGLATDGRGLAYLSLLDEGVAAFLPNQGRAWTLDVPGLSRAVVCDGVIYAVTDNRQGEIALSAFAEPTLGAQ